MPSPWSYHPKMLNLSLSYTINGKSRPSTANNNITSTFYETPKCLSIGYTGQAKSFGKKIKKYEPFLNKEVGPNNYNPVNIQCIKGIK